VTSNGSGQPSAIVCQAQGMVSVQAGCTMDEALLKILSRALASEVDLEDLALAVVERRTRFS
jgi:hypothetical protein